jgi:DNA modification methylase
MDFVGLDMKKIEFEASPVFDKQMDTFFERKEAKLLKAEEDGFEPQDGGTVTDIVIGDLFEIGHHRLLCGDSTDSDAVAKLMNGEKADMYLTDAPYGVSYADKNKFLNSIDNGNRVEKEIQNDHETVTDMYQFWRNVATTAILFINDVSTYYWFSCDGDKMMMMMMALKDSGFAVKHELIWVKNNHVLGRTDYAYKHEPIIYGWKIGGTHKYYGEFCTSVFEYPKPLKNDLHPTMKPIELLEKLITNSSLESNIVLDSFLGSGSTMVASHQLNRKCYGMELEPKYCQVIVDRMRKLDTTIEIKRNGTLYTKQDGI